MHPTHYGRMCPIETPEGPNIGLIGSLVLLRAGLRARLRHHSLPGGRTTASSPRRSSTCDATQEEDKVIAQANAEFDPKTAKLKGPQVLVRAGEEEYATASPKEVDLMDVSPTQIWSVATALIPFLEHDDANRALMGSNMQRQAVPLLKPDAAADRHRHGAPRRGRHRRRGAGRERRRGQPTSTPSGSSSAAAPKRRVPAA